jgi:hypothetical protein
MAGVFNFWSRYSCSSLMQRCRLIFSSIFFPSSRLYLKHCLFAICPVSDSNTYVRKSFISYLSLMAGGRCYKFHEASEGTNWAIAKINCETQGAAGHLASIHSPAENGQSINLKFGVRFLFILFTK